MTSVKSKFNFNIIITFSYPYHGGTNFGFNNGMYGGMYGDNAFRPMTTSYDFNSLISDIGKLTSKYWIIRHAIQKVLSKL